MMDNPQAHGYQWAFHPREGFKYHIHKENAKESAWGI
jgi:hypothetical protein